MATIPDNLSSVDNIVLAIEAAKEDPQSVRDALLGQTTMEIDFGSHGKTSFRLVGVCNDLLADNTGYAALSFFACSTIGYIQTDQDNTNGYNPSSPLGQSLPVRWDALVDQVSSDGTSLKNDLIVPVIKEYNTSLTDTSTMVFENLWIPSCAELGLKYLNYYESDYLTDNCPVSGETLDWFKDVEDVYSEKRLITAPSGLYYTRDVNFELKAGNSYNGFPVEIFTTDGMPAFCPVGDLAPCFSVGRVPFPPIPYLSGDWKGEGNDQPQTLNWIAPDTEHKFFDETGNWSVIDSSSSSRQPGDPTADLDGSKADKSDSTSTQVDTSTKGNAEIGPKNPKNPKNP